MKKAVTAVQAVPFDHWRLADEKGAILRVMADIASDGLDRELRKNNAAETGPRMIRVEVTTYAEVPERPTDARRFLFLGGPWNEQVHELPADRYEWRVPVITSPIKAHWATAGVAAGPSENINVDWVTYVRREVAAYRVGERPLFVTEELAYDPQIEAKLADYPIRRWIAE